MTFHNIHSLSLHGHENTTSKSQQHQQSKKAVRFAANNQYCATITRDDYTVAEVKACWWTANEKKARQRVVMTKLEKVVASPNHCITKIIRAMQDSVYSLDSYWLDSDNENADDRVAHFVRWTSHCKSLRGLERYVTTVAANTCGNWSSYHRSHIAQDIRLHILGMQEELLSSPSSSLSSSRSMEDIAVVYGSMSKPASLFALFMARGDSQQVCSS
jgi:hypothetical protein